VEIFRNVKIIRRVCCQVLRMVTTEIVTNSTHAYIRVIISYWYALSRYFFCHSLRTAFLRSTETYFEKVLFIGQFLCCFIFFRRYGSFRSAREFAFPSPGGSTISTKLGSKIVKNSRNQQQSFCAQLCIDIRKISIKFYCCSLVLRTLMCIYAKNFPHIVI